MQHISCFFPSGPICVHRLGEVNPDGTRLCAKNNTKFSNFYSLVSKIVERRQPQGLQHISCFFPSGPICVHRLGEANPDGTRLCAKNNTSFLIFIPW